MGNRLLRFSAAMMLLIYGFAKVNGSQFTILDTELDKPMGQVSGFWLTWYYFGYSAFYGNFLALVEILGAMLLTFRRTALLGACILAPMLANIVLIDLFYGVDVGAMLVAVLLLGAMIWIIAPHLAALQRVLIPPSISGTSGTVWKWGVRVAMLLLAASFTWWVANYNNRSPTPIDGTWDVVRVEPSTMTETIPVRIFFESNRAFWVSFKLKDGSYHTHHFAAAGGKLDMWERWLQKDRKIFEGAYLLSGSSLEISGTWADAGMVRLHLTQRQVR